MNVRYQLSRYASVKKLWWAFFAHTCSHAYALLKNIRVGRRVRFYGFPRVFNEGSVTLGENVNVYSTPAYYRTSAAYHKVLFTTFPTGRIVIGDNVDVHGTSIVSESLVQIGSNVMIGANCLLIDSDMHPLSVTHRWSSERRHVHKAPISIGDNVWLGLNVTVLKGVTIGENSIIGVGSVVTKSIPANTVAAGNPAKVIKRLPAPRPQTRSR